MLHNCMKTLFLTVYPIRLMLVKALFTVGNLLTSFLLSVTHGIIQVWELEHTRIKQKKVTEIEYVCHLLISLIHSIHFIHTQNQWHSLC